MIGKLISASPIITTFKSNTKTEKSSTENNAPLTSKKLTAPSLAGSRTISAKSQTMESFRELPISHQVLLKMLSVHRTDTPEKWLRRNTSDLLPTDDMDFLATTDKADHLSGSNFDKSFAHLIEQGFIEKIEEENDDPTLRTLYRVIPSLREDINKISLDDFFPAEK